MPRSPHIMPCCLEVPSVMLEKARYAMQTLLHPLCLQPEWVSRDELSRPGLYYGTSVRHVPEGVVAVACEEATWDYFMNRGAYPTDQTRWVDEGGTAWPVLFPFQDVETEAPDWIASAFFWLSGWQEYVRTERDEHGRFPYRASLQARLGTVMQPAVDFYREKLAEELARAGIPIQPCTWNGRAWALCPTHDIDYILKWRRGILFREGVHYFLRNDRKESFGTRLGRLGWVLQHWIMKPDPYRYSFERMQAEEVKRGAGATYFLKTYAPDPHDVWYDVQGRYMKRRIAELKADGFEIGLHPNYLAHKHSAYMYDESQRLAEVLEAVPRSVRQHYLRYEAPITPRLQQAVGFYVDSTLGFAEHEGFRNATCLPFQIYDIEADQPLDLWEMPLAVMDSTIFNYRKLNLEQAQHTTRQLLDTCRRFNGVCVGLWHNIVYDPIDCPGWGEHFEATLDAALAQRAFVGSIQDTISEWVPALTSQL